MTSADYSALEAQHAAATAALRASGARLGWWPSEKAIDAVLGWYAAVDPAGSAADHVVVTGVSFDKTIDGQQFPALIVTCAEFGAIPEGWESSVETFDDPAAFFAAYRPMSDAERSVLALEAAAAAKEATKAADDAEIERAARRQLEVDRRVADLKKGGAR